MFGRCCFVFVRKFLLLLSIVFMSMLFSGCPCESERELGVYSLYSYEDSWKGYVGVSSAFDPYEDFWNVMNGGSGAPYADDEDSKRYKNEQVNILSVLPIPGDTIKGWDDFDLVFFYGHNNMIVPPHPHDLFGYYTYNGTTWTYNTGYLDDIGWGYTTPYDYYTYPGVTTGNTHPGSVTYLYYKYTSCLLGGLYHYGQGTGHQWRLHWDDPVQTTVYEQLGNKDLEWLILHGCQAVITADEYGVYNSMGLQCFHWTQGSFHIVLGHYISYYTYMLEPLAGFAYDLLDTVPVQEAYFDVDPDNNSSAIAAEPNPFPGWPNSTMSTDNWINPLSDNKDASIFTQRWITPVGGLGSHWD